MNIFCNVVLTIIFLFVSGFHFYWAFGGKIGIQKTIPTTEKGIPLFIPGIFPCFFVAFIFVIFILVINGIGIGFLSNTFYLSLLIAIALIFLLRCVGDFRYVGFFKKIKKTIFANYDQKFYSPLCFLIFLMVTLKIILLTHNF